jgi:hypothetical protein
MLVALELHIPGLTLHSSLSLPLVLVGASTVR